MTFRPRTVLFWGAGATASLGIRTTERQARFLDTLAPGSDNPKSLHDRVCDALGANAGDLWKEALCDLLKILGDREVGDVSPAERIHEEQLAAMKRNWGCDDEAGLRGRIVELRGLYDWPALIAAIHVCPGRGQPRTGSAEAPADGGFQLVDLFNLLDMHRQSGHGFSGKDAVFLPLQRVLGARGALGLLIQTLFYIDWHARAHTHPDLNHHYDFAAELGRRMQRQGCRIAAEGGPHDFEKPSFVLGDVSVVSMNWDPIGLWAQFVANRDLNGAVNVPHVDSPARRMQLYHDLGHFVAGPRVQKCHPGSAVWEPMNVSSARQLNDRDHGADVRVRVGKYLFPHGCLWWRECPNCGKLSSYMGDVWQVDSQSLLPPPPLKAFVDTIDFQSWCHDRRESCEWRLGKVDARACVHCMTLTYAHHTPVVLQTSFKTPPPPFLEEMQREMRIVVQDADHIVFMGYSLPPDDVTYRAFLAARVRKDSQKPPVRCSVVGTKGGERRWLYPEELQTQSHGLPKAVKAARELFGPEHVRYFGAGIPRVFLDGGATVSADAVGRLLAWGSGLGDRRRGSG